MKIKAFSRSAMLPPVASLALMASLALAGCGQDNRRPEAAMPMQSTPTAPKKPPSTTEEKIQAIQNSSLPEKDKQAAIERVRSGKL